MLYEITKTVKETVELNLPLYTKCNDGIFWKITETELTYIIVMEHKAELSIYPKYGGLYNPEYSGMLHNALSNDPATEADFVNAFNRVMSIINPIVNNAQLV